MTIEQFSLARISEDIGASQPLAREYSAWARAGLGGRLWSFPVFIEPPFEPFLAFPRYLPPAVDDGRCHTLLSLLYERVAALISAPKAIKDPIIYVDGGEEVWQFLRRDAAEYAEYRAVLPPGLNVPKEALLCLFSHLSHCSRPMSFEMIGLPESIQFQVAVGAEDAPLIEPQLHALFPEVPLIRRENCLIELWRETNAPDVILMDFGLAREFAIPMATHGELRTDPHVGIAGALGCVGPGEIAVFQVMFEPVRNAWAESLARVMSVASDAESQIRRKISSALYGVVARAGVAGTGRRVQGHARALASCMGAFASHSGNALVPLSNDRYEPSIHEEDLITRQTRRSGMLLNAEELLSLAHFPGASVRHPKLERVARMTKAAPKEVLGNELILGINAHNGEEREATLSLDQRFRHVHVIGASGTGKSNFLLHCILQDIGNGHGVGVLDPHGDLISQIVGRLPRSRIDDVVLVDPSDEQFPVGFNILSAHSSADKTLLSSDLVSVFRRLSTSWGDQMNSILSNAILAFLESGRGGTLSDLRRFLVEPAYRSEFLETVRDPEVAYYWRREYPLLGGSKSQGPLLTRLDALLRPKAVRHMVSQRGNSLDFREMMDSGKIFLARLSQGAIGEENSYVLGTLFVSKFHQAAMGRQEAEEGMRPPFFLYVDEFHNYACPSLAAMLSGARKYRLGLLLAHQDMGQLGRDSEVASSIITNPCARVCFRLGDADARRLSEGFESFEPRDLQSLGAGEAICRVGRSDFDFNIRVPLVPSVSEDEAVETRTMAVAASRARYAAPLAQVEAELRDSRFCDEVPRAGTIRRMLKAQDAADSASNNTDDSAPTDTKASLAAAVRLPGKGGARHRRIQQILRERGERAGFRAEVERATSREGESVDVSLKCDALSIACEIAITTSVEHELGNMEKCVREGYSHVLVIAEGAAKLRSLQDAACESFGSEALSKLRFLSLPEALAFIDGARPAQGVGAQKVKGYRVDVVPASSEPGSGKGRPRRIIEIISDALGWRRKK